MRPLHASMVLAILGLVAPSLAQPASTGIPVLLDGNDAVVGILVDMTDQESPAPDYATSVLFALDQPIVVRVVASGPSLLRGVGTNGPVHFTGPDCTGNPYLPGLLSSQDRHFLATSIVNPPGGAVLYALPAGTAAETITVASAMQINGSCAPIVATGSLFPAIEVVTSFEGPYRVGSIPLAGLPTPLDVPTADTYGLFALGLALLLTALVVLRRMPTRSRRLSAPTGFR